MINTAYSFSLNRQARIVFGVIAAVVFFATLSPAPVAADCTPLPFSSLLPSVEITKVCKEEPVAPAVVEVEDDDVCVTQQTRMAVKDDVVSIFSNFVDGNPNGMLIAEIPLSAIRAVTDEEKASNMPILVASKDSNFADGWHVDLYWFDNHYGVAVSGESGRFYDATNNCNNF